MITLEQKEKAIAKCVEIHDLIKGNPFWINFDYSFLKGLLKQYDDLSSEIWPLKYLSTENGKTEYDRTNPYAPLLNAVTHDFNAMLSWMRYRIAEDKTEDIRKFQGEIVQVLQTYLSIAHSLLLGHTLPKDESATSYTFNHYGYSLQNYEHICKLKALYDEDRSGWHAYEVTNMQYLPLVKKYLEKVVDRNLTESSVNWAKDGLNDIQEGRIIIGRHWIIEK